MFRDDFRSTYGFHVLYIVSHPFPAFACLHGTCTGLQLDNIVHRVQHASSFKMMYRNLGTSGGEANSVNSPHILYLISSKGLKWIKIYKKSWLENESKPILNF